MPITLFVHNRQAYTQAKAVIAKTGKAADLLTLSLGVYLQDTAGESERCSRGLCPGEYWILHICKAHTNDPGRTGDIHPDCTVLDEFHRCGAQM